MKKIFLLLMLISVLLLLASCSRKEVPIESTFPTELTIPAFTTEAASTETTAAPVHTEAAKAPLISVSLPTHTETVTANDGREIFAYTFQNISLITQDPDVADQVIIDFLNRIDGTRLTADRIYSMAQSAYAGQADWSTYLCMISYEPKRIDPGILSLFGTQAAFYGSTHPETVYSAVTYDLVTGSPLTLGDILLDEDFIGELTDAVLSVLTSQKDALFLYDEFPKTVRELFSGSQIQNCWYFTEQGLCFYFTPYEIAPYSMGVVTATVPYEELTGILQDAYFPGETDTASGVLQAQNFTADALTSYQRFTELVQDIDGNQYLLFSDDIVRNVRIETGFWSATGSFYTPQHTIYTASALSPGDALMIQAEITPELPQLRVSYETDSGKLIRFITVDSSGNIILKPQ